MSYLKENLFNNISAGTKQYYLYCTHIKRTNALKGMRWQDVMFVCLGHNISYLLHGAESFLRS
jgi:hypothetical protein